MNLSGVLPLVRSALPRRLLQQGTDGRARAVLGVPDAAKPAVIAALATQAEAPLLVITGKDDHALALSEALADWLGEGERIIPFPESDSTPYERDEDRDAAEERLHALRRLHEWRPGSAPPVLVAPALALAQRTIAPDELSAASLAVQEGGRLPMRTLLAALERLGYELAALVEAPGQAARRGGIVDVFPPGGERPVRIELLGDRVDSLRAFDPATQRSAMRLTEAVIGPAREAQIDVARASALREGLDFSTMQHGLRPRFEEELDELIAGARTDPGFYAPFLPRGLVLDHLPPGSLIVVDEPGDTAHLLDDLDAQAADTRVAMESQGLIPRGLPLPHAERREVFDALGEREEASVFELQRWATDDTPGATVLPFGAAMTYGGRLRTVLNDAVARRREGRRLILVSQQSARLAELFESDGMAVGVVRTVPEPAPVGSLTLLHGSLDGGWTLDLPDGPLDLVTDREIFGFTKQRRVERRSKRGREAFLSELTPGDYVVHVEHGIGRFARLTRRVADGAEREYLELHYAEGDRLFVPTDQLDRVSRYVGPSEHRAQLTRLSSGEWARTKERVRRAVSDLAQDLLRLYAAREVMPGHAYSPDTAWQQEMEGAFPYVETADQLTALGEIKGDMERGRPMDRVVIGDVGYGKTELAIRAAFKAVMDGRQVAVLVPTTVLAQQHFQTFKERVSGFPVRVDVLSRFRSERDQREIAADVATGRVDILIGTHRILQKDISFKGLGLVIIDEEQRFGVSHKERLKEIKTGILDIEDGATPPVPVDVLTLSATPIPRTLHMSLSGIRDMSTLDTAPEDRLPIKTYVMEFDERIIRESILRELDRGGQVYVVHNRVYNIELIADRIREIVPEASVAVGHGQMPEETLEQVMVDFQRGAHDVLVCTTIIESGLDIPNVNTIIINQADRLGLSQLYQLRGRVGRGAHRAYAYLMYDRHHAISEVAQKRLQAVFEAQELGAGFQIALKDLEIRGAGNLLGAEQSGHIGAVGYELYSQMLSEAVTRMRALQRGEMPPPPPSPPITLSLPLTAHIPEPYIGDLNLRLATYQRLAGVSTLGGLDDAIVEMTDRFGPPPPVVQHLFALVRVRVLARGAGLQSIVAEDGDIVLRAAAPIAHRERLKGAFDERVRPGSAQIRIEQVKGDGWVDLLTRVLERLQSDWAPPAPAPPKKEDYGTFAVDVRSGSSSTLGRSGRTRA